MNNVKFNLRQTTGKTPVPIHLIFRYNGTVLNYNTGVKILPSHWNKEQQKATRKQTNYSDVNNYLNKLAEHLESSFLKSKLKGIIPTNVQLKQILDDFTNNGKKKDDVMTFNKFIDVFINEKTRSVTPSTKKQYYTFKNLFEHYQAECKKTFDFEDFNLMFERDFKAFHVKKEYSTNYTGRNIKILKTILNEAAKLGHNTNTYFNNYTKPQETVFKIYLNDSDLAKIQACELVPHLDRIRDVFLFLCNTGLRFSDYATFDTTKHLEIRQQPTGESYRVVLVTTQKTSTPVAIPTTKLVESILAKYEDALPKIASQHINDGIKEIGQIAGINDTVTISTKIGTTTNEKQYKKYELITTHTGRRSFCTNAYKNGIPAIQLMKLTGHKTEAIFFQYIKIGNEENAQKLANHSFFNL